MKRKYLQPSIRQMRLGGSSMMASSLYAKPGTTVEGDNGGWSKQFWGIVEDNDVSSSSSDDVNFPAD